jgi:hypothetical protein
MTHVSRWQRLVGMAKCEAAGVPRGGRCRRCTVSVGTWESFLSGLKRTTGSQLTAWREKMLNNNQGLVNRGCIVIDPPATKS